MGNNRSKVPDLEKLVKGGRKKFVRYEEGAMLYSMGIHTFQQLAKDARAVYHRMLSGICPDCGCSRVFSFSHYTTPTKR